MMFSINQPHAVFVVFLIVQMRYIATCTIQEFLLQVLKEENNYFGILTLINKFQNVCPK